MRRRRPQVIHPQVDGGDAVIKLAASPDGKPAQTSARRISPDGEVEMLATA
jgi:hypothetical protein